MKVRFFSNAKNHRNNAKVIRNLTRPVQYYPKQSKKVEDSIEKLNKTLKDEFKSLLGILFKKENTSNKLGQKGND